MSPSPEQVPDAPVDEVRARRRRRSLRYVASLDGLRAIAALGVVIIHTESESDASIRAYVYTGAVVGPFFMLFFAISGFVLYRGWARRHMALRVRRRGEREAVDRKAPDGGADGRTGSYLVRRLLRIYPLYWVVATVALIVSSNGTHHQPLDYVQVYLLLPFPNPQALVDLGLGIVVWTLIIDVVFYIYVAGHGAVMYRLIHALRNRYTPFVIETTVLFLMAATFVIAGLFVPAPVTALVCLPAGMWFAVCEAEQEIIGYKLGFFTTLVRIWPLVAVLYLTVGPVVVESAAKAADYGELLSTQPLIHFLLVLLSLWVLIVILWAPRSWAINRWLTSRPMRAAGLLTYGTYLWHPVVLLLLEEHLPDAGLGTNLVITVVGSTCLAAITYAIVERPLANVRLDLRGDRRRRPDPQEGPPSSGSRAPAG